MSEIMNNKNSKISLAFYDDIKKIINDSRNAAIRSVDVQRVHMYWRLGERIFIEEQRGKDRAEYGEYLVRNLAEKLESEFGSGFTIRQLERARQFYRRYPIATALRTQLNWVRPAWAHTCGCKSRRELVTVSEVNRNCTRATECGKEARIINREPMDKNRIEGAAKQGERAQYREALVTKSKRRRCGGCAMKVCVLTWGDLASRLKGRR